ncbi:unnamed protein product [Staurois parvus]|uniref:Uncharacterized protein n=1 Tax=Staurois parvus TaxID=386267 RepID=A0ABN9D884_9NEOB|nr:unnamed protein product [Staurois parvus]
MRMKKKKKKRRRSRTSAAKSVSAESSAISDSSLTVPSHLQRLKHCIYLFQNKNICILNGNK